MRLRVGLGLCPDQGSRHDHAYLFTEIAGDDPYNLEPVPVSPAEYQVTDG